MIEFMVIAAPRSGTTWASNWLTTDTTICLHDPLYKMHYSDIDNFRTTKCLGISCTGIAYFHRWLNNHPARKVILHRDKAEIDDSLCSIGMPPMDEIYFSYMKALGGVHVNWRDIFDNPRYIYEYLLNIPFDEERHRLLLGIEMQPDFEGLTINKGVTSRLIREVMTIRGV